MSQYLERYMESIEGIPSDFRRSFAQLRDLDEQLHGIIVHNYLFLFYLFLLIINHELLIINYSFVLFHFNYFNINIHFNFSGRISSASVGSSGAGRQSTLEGFADDAPAPFASATTPAAAATRTAAAAAATAGWPSSVVAVAAAAPGLETSSGTDGGDRGAGGG